MTARVVGFAAGLGVCTAIAAALLSPLVPLPWPVTVAVGFAVGFVSMPLAAWTGSGGPIDPDEPRGGVR